MNRFLALLVVVLLAADALTLGEIQQLRARTAPPDLTPRVAQLEKDVAQDQQDIGEMKQELAIIARRGQPSD